MTDNVVSLSGGPIPNPSVEPDANVIHGATGLLERAVAGEIIGFQAQVIYRDQSVGSFCYGLRSVKQLGEMFLRATRLAEQLDR